MIEIPESITLAKQLHSAFLGRSIEHIEVAYSPHGFAFYSHDAEEYGPLLQGKTLTDVRASGGHVELIFEDMYLVFSEGVNFRFCTPESTLPKKHQFYIRFNDDSGFVCTVQMYGCFMLYPHGESDNFYYLVSRELPSPLSEEFNETYFSRLIEEADPKLSAKALLATEQRIPGLGNGVLQDILFNACIHPQRKLSTLDKSDHQAMFHSIKTTLNEMVKAGGRDVEKDLYGNPGGYTTILSNKTKDEPCPRCGASIIKKAYLGGAVYFCQSCQSP